MSQSDFLREMELLINSRHSLIHINSQDDERLRLLLDSIAGKINLPLLSWSPARGFSAKPKNVRTAGDFKAPNNQDPFQALLAIYEQDREIFFHIQEFQTYLTDPKIIDLLKKIGQRFNKHRGALVFNRGFFDVPSSLRPFFTCVELQGPGPEEFGPLIDRIIRDASERQALKAEVSANDKQVLLNSLNGLTLMEAERILTKAFLVDGKLDSSDIQEVLHEKKKIIAGEGILEYFPTESTMADIAGLNSLKGWVRKRKEVFLNPDRAAQYKLPFPRGILLLGVQGCGKSLCAKVVAKEWSVPLLKLDPSNLYSKYIGETEQNLKTAIRVAEAMAPIVLWIDEIEKAFAGVQNSDSDGGLSRRIFGTFISWMQEKKDPVFVVATANDISVLPPELLRKGRFDELFFVDLPTDEARKIIFEIQFKKKNLTPGDFNMAELVKKTAGFSGSEIEQVVVSGLYSALMESKKPDSEIFLNEIKMTKPLSVTMSEKIETLREWAKERTVPAE